MIIDLCVNMKVKIIKGWNICEMLCANIFNYINPTMVGVRYVTYVYRIQIVMFKYNAYN